MAIIGKFPFKKIFHYMLAQYLGAFVAAGCTYGVYLDALNGFDGGIRAVNGPNGTAGIWTTYPETYLTLRGGCVDQIVGTFILLFVICAIIDPRNTQVHKSLYALYIGILVITIGISLGSNCGYAINPARDLSPRLFLMVAGWGKEAFTSGNFWWIPIVGPHIGAILGTILYYCMIEIHAPKEEDEDEDSSKVFTKQIRVLAASKQ